MNNFVWMVVRKPLSAGAIFFFWMPGIGGLLALIVLGIHYWYITLGAFILICMVAGTQADERTTKAKAEREAFENESLCRRDKRLRLIYQIRSARCSYGDLSSEVKALWSRYHELEAADQSWWDETVMDLIKKGAL